MEKLVIPPHEVMMRTLQMKNPSETQKILHTILKNLTNGRSESRKIDPQHLIMRTLQIQMKIPSKSQKIDQK